MSLSGSIEDLPLLEILQVVSFCQKTGFLTVSTREGQSAVVFRDGRVVSGYIWDTPTPPSAPEPEVRGRIGAILARLVRLREGRFAFNLAESVPTHLGGRDLSGDTLGDGINPEELMLELARKLDEDRRDGAASIEATFTATEVPVPEGPPDDVPAIEDDVPTLEEAASAAAAATPLPPPIVTSLPAEGHEASRPVVLLVDDEPDVCRVVGRRLDDAGFETIVAASQARARREMLQLSASRRPFLLVVDLGLPSESGSSFRGGLDVVRDSSGLPLPPPVLLMSETIDEKLRGRARRLGVSLLSFKPGLSKLDPLQYEADLRAFADKLARDLLPRLSGRRGGGARKEPGPPAIDAAPDAVQATLLERALAEIESGPEPDTVALLLLRVARAFYPRVVLFVVKDDRLRGLAGFGPVEGKTSLDLVARELSVPLDAPSPFREAVASGRPWTGALPGAGPLAALVDRLGRLDAKDAAIVPLLAARETIAVAYVDAPDGSPLAASGPFAAFVERAGRALDGALGRRTPIAPA